MAETYSIKCECSNCGYKGAAAFERGIEVPDQFVCPNCGCCKASKWVDVNKILFPTIKPLAVDKWK